MKRLFLYTAAVLSMTACNNEVEVSSPSNWNGEINFATEIMSRATSNLAKDVPVYIYVNKSDGSQLYGKTDFLSDGQGGLTSSTLLYYPDDSQNINAYGFINANPGENLVKFTHTVSADQKEYSSDSDILCAITPNVASSPNAVRLTFKHLMSNISIALKPGLGDPDLSNVSVSVIGAKTSAELDFASNPTDFTNLVEATGNASPISVSTVVTNDFETNTDFAQAIVAPQNVEEGTEFIEVIYNDKTLKYSVPAGGLNLESGKKYIYQFVVNDGSNVTLELVSANIENWTDGDEFNGSAVIDKEDVEGEGEIGLDHTLNDWENTETETGSMTK